MALSNKREYSMTYYLKPSYHRGEMGKLVRRAKPKLRNFRKKHPFDAIAFCGYSGAAIAAVLSWELNIPMIAVRKEQSHDNQMTFGVRSINSYIIVDDFVSSGETINRIVDAVHKFATNKQVSLAGVFCYYPSSPRRKIRELSYWDRYFGDHRFGNVPVRYL